MLRFTCKILILGAVVVLAGLRPALATECTESSSTACHIGSATLEINLGPLPIDNYLERNNGQGGLSSNCPTTSSVRSCIISYLKNYKSQGVTGVRFLFGLGGGGHSTAFNSDGTVNRKWADNLQMFFSDLARNVGIKNITPTPVLGYWGGGDVNFSTSPASVTSCGGTETLIFVKWLPYGLRTGDYLPACQDKPTGYEDADSNSNFWGWQKFFNLMDAVLSRAAAQGLTVRELDLQNEIDLLNFTVQARLIYDESHSENVFGTMHTLMVKYYGTGADSRVTYSTLFYNPGRPSSDPNPEQADGSDCTSFYGDTALIIGQSELRAAYDGERIGIPDNLWQTKQNDLACGTSSDSTYTFLHSYTQPSINDIHPHICIPKPGTGYCYDPQADSLSANYGSATARNFYNGFWTFLNDHGFTTHKAMLGETNHVQSNPCASPAYDKSMAFSNVNGFNGYNNTDSSLHYNAVGSTIFRLWEDERDSCYVMPEDIDPPYTP